MLYIRDNTNGQVCTYCNVYALNVYRRLYVRSELGKYSLKSEILGENSSVIYLCITPTGREAHRKVL